MKAKVKKLVKLVKQDVQEKLPNGSYSGVWGGYVVEFYIDGEKFEASTDVGVRGINIPCVVSINNGEITIK